MEDPWGSGSGSSSGSPWAADSPVKIELPAAPQNAHFSAADHLFPRRNSRSPVLSRSRSPAWEDDDAWGGWNGGDANSSGKESPGWGRSPGLKPLKTTSSVRSLSPDPWKDVALKRLDTTAALENGERKTRGSTASETSGDDRVVDSAISLGEEQQLSREKELKNNIPVAVTPWEIDAAGDAWRVGAAPEASATEAAIPAIRLEQPAFSPVTEAPVSIAVCGKEQDEVLSTDDESVRKEEAIIPRGSFEVEEEQQQQQQQQQQQPIPIVEAIPTIEAIDETAIIPGQKFSQPPLGIDNEVIAETQYLQQESQIDIPPVLAMSEPAVLETLATPFKSEIAERPASRTPKLHYPIDLTKLDDLFPSTPPVTTEAELVPDVIISDTFASSSECRAWYRISRYGSKRKHDMGGDENYVCVSWSQSQIRERATQTVRRWMEEDSITGRVVLGRRLGGSGAVMFNWNSPAPQVEIGEFLGRHSRNSSLTMQSAVSSPTTSSFGWASSVPSSPAISRHPLANEIPHGDAQEVPSLKDAKADSVRQSLSLEPPPPYTRAHIPTPIQIPPTYPINQDDDDDWGEMMTATPTTILSFTEDEETISNRHSIPSHSALQFDTVFESSKPLASKTEKTPSKRPFSWHLGQTLSKPFKRGSKTPLTPSFPSPLSKPMTPPQVTPTRHTHTMSADTSLVQSPPRSTLSAADEETVARLLEDIPDLTYMLR